ARSAGTVDRHLPDSAHPLLPSRQRSRQPPWGFPTPAMSDRPSVATSPPFPVSGGADGKVAPQVARHLHGRLAPAVVAGHGTVRPVAHALVEALGAEAGLAHFEAHDRCACRERRLFQPAQQRGTDPPAAAAGPDREEIEVGFLVPEAHDGETADAIVLDELDDGGVAVADGAEHALGPPAPPEPGLDEIPGKHGDDGRIDAPCQFYLHDPRLVSCPRPPE